MTILEYGTVAEK